MRWPLLIRCVVGDSMLPALKPGQYVVATGWIKHLYSGEIVIVVHDGKEKIKRIQTVKDGKIYVLGDNDSASTDSRHFGWLERSAVSAKVIWPK